MDAARIAELLDPFGVSSLSPSQVERISTYIDLLLKWNARMNLTAVRAPEEIVTRHFGESLFAARHLFPETPVNGSVIDIGSGAGFPGLPIKIWNPAVHLTLIEAQQRKATFLKEVSRAITLTNIDVFAGRAEQYQGAKVGLVTLRAVERFETILPTAATLAAESGRVAILVGEPQLTAAQRLCPRIAWQLPVHIPLSKGRILLVGKLLPGEPKK